MTIPIPVTSELLDEIHLFLNDLTSQTCLSKREIHIAGWIMKRWDSIIQNSYQETNNFNNVSNFADLAMPTVPNYGENNV